MTKPLLTALITTTAMILLTACATTQTATEAAGTHVIPGTPPLILVSIDAFRADYLDRGLSPNLKALADGGAHAAMHPSFPSITFPNHYTLVTGLYPDHHGVIENTMRDPARPGVVFKGSNPDTATDRFWWDGGTPMWDTVEQDGGKVGVEFWPGSEAAVQGMRPTYYSKYDKHVTDDARVDQILSWMDLPAGQRPDVYLLYFDVVDTAGHNYGPDSPELNAAIADVDEAIGRLEAGLKARGVVANQIIVADHGMSAISPDRAYFIEDYLPKDSYIMRTTGPVATLDAAPGHEAEVDKLTHRHFDHMQCWHKADVPARFHFGTNPRIPQIVCAAEPRWLVDDTHAQGIGYKAGAHGYDNLAPDMQALFIANGPAIKPGVTLAPFINVDVYDLEMKLAGLKPHANDGTLAPFGPALK